MGEGGATAGAVRARAANDLQQMIGIVQGLDTQVDHYIVARVLALVAKPAIRQPEQRMKPVHGADDSGEQLDHPVATLDVRELVSEHRSPPIV